MILCGKPMTDHKCTRRCALAVDHQGDCRCSLLLTVAEYRIYNKRTSTMSEPTPETITEIETTLATELTREAYQGMRDQETTP